MGTTVDSRAELLGRLRAKRELPPKDERRRIRKDAGASLRDVGAALGVSHSLVRYWEDGGTPREHRSAYAALLDELRLLAGEPRKGGDG